MMKKEYVVARCVDEVRSGRATVEDCVKQYPAIRDLKPLLETAMRIQPNVADLPEASRARMREGVLAAVKQAHPAQDREKPIRPAFAFRTAGAIAAVLAAVAIVGGGSVYASQRSLPGDALYAVKTGTENIQLALTFGNQGKAGLRLKLAQRRVEEMAAEAARGSDGEVSGSAIASELDKAIKEAAKLKAGQTEEFAGRLAESSLHGQLTLDAVASSKTTNKQLQTALDVLRRSKLIAEVSYENPSFLKTRPSVLDDSLEGGQFKVSGVLDKADAMTWQIDGLTLNNVHSAGDTPAVGSRVLTQGVTRGGQTYVVKVEKDDDTSQGASIQGRFDGTGEGGSVWFVSGISVTAPKNASPPSKGDHLHLQRPATGSAEGFSQVETKQPEHKGVEYDGKLSAVNPNAQTVTVSKAGTHITVKVTGAAIRGGSKQTMTLAQLETLPGAEVQVKGLYKKGGSLYAEEVCVDSED